MTHILLKTDQKKVYYLSGINRIQLDALKEAKSSNNIEEFKKEHFIEVDKVIKAGSKASAKPRDISSYVGYLKGFEPTFKENKYSRNVHFRDYNRTEERQAATSHLIVLCSDATSSAKTALKNIKEDYLVLWWKEN